MVSSGGDERERERGGVRCLYMAVGSNGERGGVQQWSSAVVCGGWVRW